MFVFVILFIVLTLLVSGLIVFLYVKTNSTPKGENGERIVAKILGETVPGEHYVINNLLFTTKDGHSCQIDHIYINRYGIWVIETKNYSGFIYGRENQQEWTQVLSYGKTKRKFYNPIKQNETHIYYLSQYLKTYKNFNNLVVFISRANIQNVSSTKVCYERALYQINDYKTDINLSVEQMENYYNTLLALKNEASVTLDAHIKNVSTMKNNLSQNICPRCNGNLVIRNSKTGQFYGCSNYPKCKFTKKIDNQPFSPHNNPFEEYGNSFDDFNNTFPEHNNLSELSTPSSENNKAFDEYNNASGE